MSSTPDFKIFTSLRHDPALLTVPDRPDITGIASTNQLHQQTSHFPETTLLTFWNRDHRSPFLHLDLHRDRLLRAAAHFGWTAAVQKLSGEPGLAFLISGLPEDIAAQFQEDHATGRARKLRICVDQDGSITHDISDTPPRPLEGLFATRLPGDESMPINNNNNVHIIAPRDPSPLQPGVRVLVDPGRTQPSAYTHFKTTSRAHYDAARERMKTSLLAATAAEVLLVNDADGSIMEGSFTTPYFWRDGRWVTPPITELKWHNSTDLGSLHAGAAPQHWTGGHDAVSRRWALERGLAVEEVIPADSLVDGEDCWLSNGVRGFFAGKIMLRT
ncbi:aminotransferase class IV-domain-containing protein [Microdochium trichocladiopsis]|uniref:Aminotransferase class IV-domain-containing protein n=1 Tax=Microdochium trichocladiopsis TaxID=1682393 RepID=A0A9P9BMS6_9PEZI|nr:aminotransferase class IV-domain-containing protein [Microdochium trichocladiopsis]KAH7026186.1 aminotransferase class IV-domain-containing protein [Microdochium trichocladiopsis]